MTRTRAGRDFHGLTEANYREFELAYYKYHPQSRSVSFERYLDNGTHVREIEEAVVNNFHGNRSGQCCGYGARGHGHRSHRFGSADRRGSRVPLSTSRCGPADDFDRVQFRDVPCDGRRGAGGSLDRAGHPLPRGHCRVPSPPPSRCGGESSRPRQHPQSQWNRHPASDGYSGEHWGCYGPQD
ncbi:hypothetical protein HO133_002921 [Letharia lupina]|uniref:Uncharacterized protein n=1 Tax=Letharia lupina TaxID=560253 RepID=A0A8H6FA96_9LECA|nr:uncharacterized protein HO133_002921 [Letharia lupina]KAF6220488.1 hypothetical protein HO133_002921 [Letharia lupina]